MNKELHIHLIYELMGYRFNEWCNQYSNNDNIMWRDRKRNYFINFTMIPYNDEGSYCSSILVLGSSSTVFQLLFSILLFAQGWLKVGTKGMLNQIWFLYYDFPPIKWEPYPLFYRLEGDTYLVE
jgi:hypothetical protein